MTVLLALGGAGVVGLLVGLVIGDLDADLDLGPDWLSLPVVAALVGAFGFGAAGLLSLGVGAPASLAGGAVIGLGLAAATTRLVRSLIDMPTDASLRSSDLLGRPGRVVTPIRPDRTGEALVVHAGQQLKIAARGAEDLAIGDHVVVVEVLSPTLVVVESDDRFWTSDPSPSISRPPPTGGPPP